ncbi:hypothetical protein IFM89_022941 [Coptis chinensis]|uniref:Reverse transcriptase zinc-binding domain-containing protein n=1 Tax=Coptis chinensis TaxID=261450 RepID=A0A835HPF3_9MAGN|nr:hypothetical protein IFM89_022941 [Coptis chinensis]
MDSGVAIGLIFGGRMGQAHADPEALHLTDRELRGCSSRRAEEDTLIWLPELKGDFSTASAFEAIRNKGVRVHCHGAVWNRFTHPKLAANAWKLYSGRALTDLATKKKGIQKRQNVSYVDLQEED